MAGVKPTTAHNNSPQQRPTTTAMAEEATITAMVGRSSKEMRKMRAIQWTRSLLEKPNEPVNDMSYFECLDTIMEKSKSLGDGMTGTANNANKALAKLGEPFGEAVKDVSNAITGLVEAALTSHVPSRRL
jgi:talin